MLTHLSVQNYRSLENAEIPFERLTAIVGPNGAGKTTILHALSVVLGDTWPSLRSFHIPQDFTGFNASAEINITARFDPPYIHQDKLKKDHKVNALHVLCRPYKVSGKHGDAGDIHVDLEALNPEGKVPTVAFTPPTKGQQPQFRPLTVGTELRDYARILIIDHRRALAQQLPTTRNSVLGRLLQKARKGFSAETQFKDAYEQAMDALRTEPLQEIEATIAETAKRMLGFLGSGVSKSIEIGFGFVDPANPFNSLRLEYKEAGLTVPGEELGLGIQSAIVVGIFEAFRTIGGEFGTIVIEEPEMYLHPQAQRYFYRLLCEMADSNQCQIIYTTHSPIFADVNRFEALRLVRREPGKNSRISHVKTAEIPVLDSERTRQKLSGRFDPTRNEILFASRALLVEGHADRVAALLVAEKLSLDVDAEGIAIVDCGGKNGIPLVAGVCKALEIPFTVLHDTDVWPVDQAADRTKQTLENTQAQAENARITKAVGTAGKIFVTQPTLENMLGIGKTAKDVPLKVVEKLQGVALKDVPAPLREAVLSIVPQKEISAPAKVAPPRG